MVENKTLLLIVGLILIGGYFYINGNGSIDIGGQNKKEVVCDVNLLNTPPIPPTLCLVPGACDSKITGASCSVSKDSCGFFSVSPFSLLSDNLVLKMVVGEKTISKGFTLTEGFTKSLTITLCVPDEETTGFLRLEEDGNLVDSKSVNF